MRGSLTVSETCTLTHGDYGVFLTLSKDNVVGASIANVGAWASHDLETMSQFIKPGMTVVDVGANVGHHTVAFAKMVGNAGRVIAYEPQCEMFRLLAANCVMNGCRNVDIHQTCVGEAAGEVRLFPISYEETNNFGGLGIDPQSIDGRTGQGELCRIDSLDSLLAGSGVSSCDFIKIDVQAFELFVLRGALKTIAVSKPPLFLEIAPFPMKPLYDYRAVYELLWSMGYETRHPGDDRVGPREVKRWSGIAEEEWDIVAVPSA